MCGACGRARAVDEWSAGLDSRRARWEVARVVEDLLAGAGCAVRVTDTPSGWLVRSPTGRASVADTLSAVWAAVGPLPRPGPAPPDPAARDAVAAAVHASFARHLGHEQIGGVA